MKIVKSPFNHKATCYCNCELHYKDSDVIAKVGDDEKIAAIILAKNEPLWERLKHECRFSSKEKAMLEEPDVSLHIFYKYINHYVKCPFCGSEVQIRPLDKNKREIYWEAVITQLKLYIGSRGKNEHLYLWYHKRIQWLIDEGLLPEDFLKNNR